MQTIQKTMNDSLIEQREMRDQMANRLEVLDKVKKINLIPKLNMTTMKQVAEYFGVTYDTLSKCYYANRAEIDNDGVSLKKYKDFLSGNDFLIKHKKGIAEIIIDENITLIIPNSGARCLSKRAILRMAMFLRDSEVAKEIRSELLNIYEQRLEQPLETVEIVNQENDICIDSSNDILDSSFCKVKRIKAGSVYRWTKDIDNPTSGRPVIIIADEKHDKDVEGKDISYVLAVKCTTRERGWATELPVMNSDFTKSIVHRDQIYKILTKSLGHYYGEVSPDVLLEIKRKQLEDFEMTARDLNRIKAQVKIMERYG